MAATERLIRTYDINLCAFMELNFNWSKVNSSANLASWLQDEERELRSVTAHNTTELDDTFGKHQQGAQGSYADTNFSSTQENHPSTRGVWADGARGPFIATRPT